MKPIELHPLCTLFPRMDGEAFATLVADVKANGLREPITLVDGMILDGGNRYRACLQAGIEPKFRKFAGDNVVTFVLSANLHRRHMTPGQQAAIVASAQDWAKAQTVGGNGANQHRSKAATLPDSSRETVADRAAVSGASERTQRMADKVARKSPELAGKVARGEISLPKAAAKIAPPKSKQPRDDGYFPWSTKPDQAPSTQVEEPEPANDEAPTLAELVDELQRENETLRKELAAIKSTMDDNDLRAQLARAVRMHEHAKREQGVAMDNAAKSQDREKFIVRMLRRCAKAVGVADPSHTDPRDIVKAVEVFVAGRSRHAA